MRCETHCPPDRGAGLRGPLAAVGAFLGLSLGLYEAARVVPDMIGVFLAVAAVALVVCAALVVPVAVVLRRSQRVALGSQATVAVVTRQSLAMARRKAGVSRHAALPAPPLALPAPRPVIPGVVASESERTGR